MATPAVIVVVTVALVSLVVLVVTVLFLLTQVRMLTASLKELRAALEPTLNDLSAETEEAQRRVERVSAQAARLRQPKRSR